MPTQTKNKFYKYEVNGRVYYEMLPDLGNVPNGYTPITAAEFISGANGLIDYLKKYPNDANARDTMSSLQKALEVANSVAPSAMEGGQSGYIINDSGKPQLLSQYQSDQQTAEDIKSGKLVQIGVAPDGKTPLYAPSGSAAASSATKATAQNPNPIPGGGTGYLGSGPGAAANGTITNAMIAKLPTLVPSQDYNSNVETLQKYLVQNGYMTQAEMDTGPGIYGKRTLDAIASWQKAAGIDPQGNPGYFGPITKEYVSKLPQGGFNAVAAPASSGTSAATGSGTGSSSATGGTTGGQSGSGTGTMNPAILSPVTGKKFQDTDAYKALPDDLKAYVDSAFNLISIGNDQDAEIFSTALKNAKDAADPYYKAQLAIASGEVLGAIARVNGDFQKESEIITRTLNELKQDVSASKDFLSLEHQAEVARESRNYEYDLLDIADQAAEKGITFATGARSRVEAENRRTTQFQDVIQSDTREYNFKIQKLEQQAANGDAEAAAKLAALNTKKTLDLQDIGRNAESILGSANIPGIDSYTPVGGVTGSINEAKTKAIIADTKAGLELQKTFTTP